ncbi:MAG TPA: response regulator [Longimicrobiales bacterium]
MRTKLILIVDDHDDTRNIFSAILNFDGYHVAEAENGEEAVAAALSFHPDMILMDIVMPVLDGFTSAEMLRSLPTTHSIPILAVTGAVCDQERVASLFNGHLMKPITPTRMLAEVQRFIGAPHVNDE